MKTKAFVAVPRWSQPGPPAPPAFPHEVAVNASGPRAVVLLGAALLVAACHPKDNGPPPAARPVVATPIAADGTTAAAILPGDIEPRYATPLSFRIGGKIIERSVRLGDTVKKGQVLAHLDPSDPEKNAASAQAQLDAASHALTYAQQQVERDRAQAREKLIAPRPARTDRERLRLGARAARPGRATAGAGEKPAAIHQPRGRSCRLHHGRTGRYRPERVGRPGRLPARLVGRRRRGERRARGHPRAAAAGPRGGRHAAGPARAQLPGPRARDRAGRRSAKPHLSRAAHAGRARSGRCGSA